MLIIKILFRIIPNLISTTHLCAAMFAIRHMDYKIKNYSTEI